MLFPRRRESSILMMLPCYWIPAFAGMTIFYEVVKIEPVNSGEIFVFPTQKTKPNPNLYTNYHPISS